MDKQTLYTTCWNCGSADHSNYPCPCACHKRGGREALPRVTPIAQCARFHEALQAPVCPRCLGINPGVAAGDPMQPRSVPVTLDMCEPCWRACAP